MSETYTVGTQTEDMDINPQGTKFIKIWKVPFEITSGPASGTYGTVIVPDTQHTAEVVAKMIAQKVAALTAIASLTGKGHA